MSTRPKYILSDLMAQSGFKCEPSSEKLEQKPARRRPKYTLEQLLAECDPNAELTDEDREWLLDPPVGREII